MRDVLTVLAPPPRLTVSEWADFNRQLSPKSSAEPGRWRTDRVPYLRGIMDALSDLMVTRIVVPKAAQIGATEAIINNVLGYYIHQDPAPILVIMPTLELAEAWSKDRLAPMIRDTPALASLVHDPAGRDSANTIRAKTFPGGRLTVIGANSPAGLSARTIRIVLGDEVDRWPVSAGTEGDPLQLAAKRQQTFWNRKSLLASTPVHKMTSVIWREYLESDMRKFWVLCRACGTPQILKWSQVKWDKGKNGEHLPETAYYLCEHCGAIWNDAERNAAIAETDRRSRAGDRTCGWIPERPGRSTAGFHISAFLSPWLTLAEIVSEFLKARHDPSLLQVWVNTVLGEPWEEPAEKLEGAGLIARGEAYGPHSIPHQVLVLTVGVDVQGDRLEIVIIGWGEHDESWVIDHQVIFGDPAQSDAWAQLDALLRTSYQNQYGHELRIRSCCVDLGGHHATQVIDFCKARWRRRIYATKGQAGMRPIWPKRASRTRNHEALYVLGVDTAKDTIYNRLRITKPGPGYIHFPACDAIDVEFFDQLTNEQVVTRKREGRPYRVWVLPSGKRNEILDCVVLALAAYKSAPAGLEGQLAPAALAPVAPPAMPERLGVTIKTVGEKPRFSMIREMARRMKSTTLKQAADGHPRGKAPCDGRPPR